ncbi:TPA: hypothetical protein DDW35_11305, partial [Candidatus Sumerlaeota bacterium]|nr:hypothetical protein [Candidatus Sumerlaeota bacterium]
MVTFGDSKSETEHFVKTQSSDTIKGGLDESARRLLPLSPNSWEGGRLAFALKVDPEKQNYATARFWGSDLTTNSLLLFCEGKQVGYRHLGDIDRLDFGGDEPAYNGRFYYNTIPLPLTLTRGKTSVQCEIRCMGPTWAYAKDKDKDKEFAQYQKKLTSPTRGIYRIYAHTEGCFVPPVTDKQGPAFTNAPVRPAPGPEVLDQVKARVNKELDACLNSPKPLNQMQAVFLANAWHVKWSKAYHNPKVLDQVVRCTDKIYWDYHTTNTVVQVGPATYNPDWVGIGPVGQACSLLGGELQPLLDQKITSASFSMTRRDAWSEMLQYSRDFHLRHRRLYTNQSMIVDLYAYLANRGVAAIDPSKAIPEEQIKTYLYESVGLQPWLGSETDKGREKPEGDNYYQLTAKGLTREFGYVGYYGEVLDWVTAIYDATRPNPGEAGDPKIKAQLEKCIHARGVFRHPMLDENGYRAMRIEANVGWRDAHYPGNVCYAERFSWDGSALFAPAATLDPQSIGYVQQMLEDNQFFVGLLECLQGDSNKFRVISGLLPIPDQYETIKAQPASNYRLPMAPGQPDFVFSDEEDGVVAIKNGDEILYASLYWRARTAVNFLARTHYMTPRFDRIAVVAEEVEFEPSGLTYERKDWVDFGFANGGHQYPDKTLHSAHAGEKLPIAKVPADVKYKPGDENVYAGKGSFYTLRYGNYLICMNMTEAKNFELKVP